VGRARRARFGDGEERGYRGKSGVKPLHCKTIWKKNEGDSVLAASPSFRLIREARASRFKCGAWSGFTQASPCEVIREADFPAQLADAIRFDPRRFVERAVKFCACALSTGDPVLPAPPMNQLRSSQFNVVESDAVLPAPGPLQ
jgi:hypothetical protein